VVIAEVSGLNADLVDNVREQDSPTGRGRRETDERCVLDDHRTRISTAGTIDPQRGPVVRPVVLDEGQCAQLEARARGDRGEREYRAIEACPGDRDLADVRTRERE